MYSKNIFAALLFVTVTFVFALSVSAATDSELESEIADLMKRDSNQQRSSLIYNAILARVARERAYDMAKRNYFSHVNPDGNGPNYLVTRAGYDLPDHYGDSRSSNNIESIAAGNETAEQTWNQWMRSPGHRTHILGLNSFDAEQVEYGIGHAFVADSRFGHYWVVITAKPAGRSVSAETPGQTRAQTPRQATVSSADDLCSGTATAYPHVIRAANGRLRPVCGYLWADDSDPKDYRVKLMPGLIRNENGCLAPAEGYKWVNKDPEDYRVKRIQ